MTFNNTNDVYVLDDTPQEIKREKKYVSKLFFRIVTSSVCAYILIILITGLLRFFPIDVYDDSFISLLLNDLYTILAIFIFIILSRKLTPQKPVVMRKMTVFEFFSFVIISIFLMFSGSVIGNIVSAYVGEITDTEMTNVVEEIVSGYPIWQIFVAVVIIAPVTEEFLFRKLIITRVTRYGTNFAVIFSGLVFGAFHGNFYQFFYASAVGILLSYVYCVYGKLRFCILIHAILNFFGSVIPLYISQSGAGYETVQNFVAYAYTLLTMISFPVGIFFMVSYMKRLKFFTVSGILIHPERTLSKNAGFITYVILTVILFVISIFA
ncbi:MAG: CPBP family intramembrane metalloprotease [Ruminococcaceae bacterium]|nr:CPBP family intramembrane metalloprotease [Oscillospiraceae bacterium]